MIKVDKITLGVIQAGLQQVCDEMDLSFSRSAFSPVISEANDRSNGIYSAINGSLISQGYNGLPVFVGTMEYSTSEIIRLIKEEKVLIHQHYQRQLCQRCIYLHLIFLYQIIHLMN